MSKLPDLQPIKSSMLHGFAHNPATGDLTVQYKNKDGLPGDTWVYEGVGVDKVHTLEHGASPGRYFNDRIKGIHNGYKIS